MIVLSKYNPYRAVINLDTKFEYSLNGIGEIFKDGKKIKPWQHLSKRPYNKVYYRIRIVMANDMYRFFYIHRLMGMAWLGLTQESGRIIRHRNTNGLDNRLSNLDIGTHKDNQVVDRILSGTYMNRGGKKKKEVEQEVYPF